MKGQETVDSSHRYLRCILSVQPREGVSRPTRFWWFSVQLGPFSSRALGGFVLFCLSFEGWGHSRSILEGFNNVGTLERKVYDQFEAFRFREGQKFCLTRLRVEKKKFYFQHVDQVVGVHSWETFKQENFILDICLITSFYPSPTYRPRRSLILIKC